MRKRTNTPTAPDDRLEDETKADTNWIVTDGELHDQSYIMIDTEVTD